MAVWSQPFPCHQPTVPCTFLFLNTPTPEFSVILLASGRGQNGCGSRAPSGLECWVPLTPQGPDAVTPWDQAPMQMGRLRPEA